MSSDSKRKQKILIVATLAAIIVFPLVCVLGLYYMMSTGLQLMMQSAPVQTEEQGAVVESLEVRVINPGWIVQCKDCKAIEGGDICSIEPGGKVQVYTTTLPFRDQVGIYTNAEIYTDGKSCPDRTMFWNPKSKDSIRWEE